MRPGGLTWYLGWPSRKDAIRHALHSLIGDRSDRVILTQAARGNVVWTVVSKPQSIDLHAIFLMPVARGASWKYRVYSERDRFKWVTCPESFLGMTSRSIQRNEVWRRQVREYHQKRRKQLKVGDRIKLVGKVPEVVVLRLGPLVGVYGGKEYKIPRRLIDLEV